MTARDELMRAVLESPFDDTPRLVYADHIEERGEPERAAFVRDHTNGLPTAFPNCLVNELKEVFLNGRMIGVGIHIQAKSYRVEVGSCEVIVERGFPSEVRLTLAEFMGGECRECHGSGEHNDIHSCYACKGTGTTPGLAAEIFSRWPVTKVVISQDPQINGIDYWVRPSGKAAEIVSQEYVNYGRSLAGLPPIQWPEIINTRW